MAVKDDIVLILEKNRGKYVSGQFMADELHVSRNAVWKAIDRLKKEGYRLNAGPEGYMLDEDCDRFIDKKLRSMMPDYDIYIYDSIDSTNNECKRRLSDKETDFAVLSEHQTEGRGRYGKSFFSPAEKGLYMSVALHMDMPFEDAVNITKYAAVCVVEEIEKLTGRSCYIKGINDVMYNGLKVCGILSEAITDMESGNVADVVVGVGINLHPSAMPTELKNIAGTLDCGSVKNELAAAIINRLRAYTPEDHDYQKKYKVYLKTA